MDKKQFDRIIRNNLVSKIGEDSFGYKTVDGRIYEDYYRNEVFCHFLRDMEKEYNEYYHQYNDGDGREFKEKRGRYGLVPPKMASVASSSRFCFLALKNGAEALGAKNKVNFEYECRIKGIDEGTAPQLDGYIEGDEIYFEVKCHEIFDSHKVKLKEKYHSHIFGEGNDFGFDIKVNNGEEYFFIPLTEFGINDGRSMMDIKQFLCHLMGIASTKKKEKCTLVYLFFKPESEDFEIKRQIDGVFAELKEDIDAIFGSKPVQNFIKKHQISLKAVAQYSKTMTDLTKENMIVLSQIDI